MTIYLYILLMAVSRYWSLHQPIDKKIINYLITYNTTTITLRPSVSTTRSTPAANNDPLTEIVENNRIHFQTRLSHIELKFFCKRMSIYLYIDAVAILIVFYPNL
jgi:hypothetical protein